MSVKVVDSSAIACVLLEEPSADLIQARIDGHILTAPTLLQFEFANVCVTNARKFPQNAAIYREALEAFYRLAIPLRDIDIEDVFDLASRHKLSAYDASYLWLALELDAELVTLDARLERAYAPLARS